MVAFPDPKLLYKWDVADQIAALRSYRDNTPGHEVPGKAADRLLVLPGTSRTSESKTEPMPTTI